MCNGRICLRCIQIDICPARQRPQRGLRSCELMQRLARLIISTCTQLLRSDGMPAQAPDKSWSATRGSATVSRPGLTSSPISPRRCAPIHKVHQPDSLLASRSGLVNLKALQAAQAGLDDCRETASVAHAGYQRRTYLEHQRHHRHICSKRMPHHERTKSVCNRVCAYRYVIDL